MTKKEQLFKIINDDTYDTFYILTDNESRKAYNGFFFCEEDKEYYVDFINRAYHDDLVCIHNKDLSIVGYYDFGINEWVELEDGDTIEK